MNLKKADLYYRTLLRIWSIEKIGTPSTSRHRRWAVNCSENDFAHKGAKDVYPSRNAEQWFVKDD